MGNVKNCKKSSQPEFVTGGKNALNIMLSIEEKKKSSVQFFFTHELDEIKFCETM